MAEAVDINECGADFWAISGLIDFRLERILWHLEDEAKKEVIADLIADFTFEELEIARKTLFRVAVQKARENPDDVSNDENDNLDKKRFIDPWQMIKRRVIGLAAQDLCDLYAYLTGSERDFPTRILRRQLLAPTNLEIQSAKNALDVIQEHEENKSPTGQNKSDINRNCTVDDQQAMNGKTVGIDRGEYNDTGTDTDPVDKRVYVSGQPSENVASTSNVSLESAELFPDERMYTNLDEQLNVTPKQNLTIDNETEVRDMLAESDMNSPMKIPIVINGEEYHIITEVGGDSEEYEMFSEPVFPQGDTTVNELNMSTVNGVQGLLGCELDESVTPNNIDLLHNQEIFHVRTPKGPEHPEYSEQSRDSMQSRSSVLLPDSDGVHVLHTRPEQGSIVENKHSLTLLSQDSLLREIQELHDRVFANSPDKTFHTSLSKQTTPRVEMATQTAPNIIPDLPVKKSEFDTQADYVERALTDHERRVRAVEIRGDKNDRKVSRIDSEYFNTIRDLKGNQDFILSEIQEQRKTIEFLLGRKCCTPNCTCLETGNVGNPYNSEGRRQPDIPAQPTSTRATDPEQRLSDVEKGDEATRSKKSASRPQRGMRVTVPPRRRKGRVYMRVL